MGVPVSALKEIEIAYDLSRSLRTWIAELD